MKHERFDLSGDGRVYMDSYILNSSPELPKSQKRPAVVVCPGGGYVFCSDREAEPVALAFSAQGFHTFVLRYSIGQHAKFPNSLCDLSRAMKLVREHSEEWGVDENSVAVCGFSAGGHLVASLGVHWNDPEVQKLSGCEKGENRPDALVLCYPVISHLGDCPRECLKVLLEGYEGEEREPVSEKLSLEKYVGDHTPPCFIMHTFYDQVVPVENSLIFAKALADGNIPFELHVLQNGGHGLALANDATYAGQHTIEPDYAPWTANCVRWLKELFETREAFPITWETAKRRRR